MVAWKKLHKADSLGEYVEKMSEEQFMAFSIGDVLDYSTFLIMQSNFNIDKLAINREKFSKPSVVAELVYKKFKGDKAAMEAFIESFNEYGQDAEAAE